MREVTRADVKELAQESEEMKEHKSQSDAALRVLSKISTSQLSRRRHGGRTIQPTK